MNRTWTEQQIRGLGAATDLVTAGSILGIGRTTAYELARTGRFPVPVLRVGRRYRVPVAPILSLLHLTPPAAAPPSDNAGARTVRPARARVDGSEKG